MVRAALAWRSISTGLGFLPGLSVLRLWASIQKSGPGTLQFPEGITNSLPVQIKEQLYHMGALLESKAGSPGRNRNLLLSHSFDSLAGSLSLSDPESPAGTVDRLGKLPEPSLMEWHFFFFLISFFFQFPWPTQDILWLTHDLIFIMFRHMISSTVLCPGDAVASVKHLLQIATFKRLIRRPHCGYLVQVGESKKQLFFFPEKVKSRALGETQYVCQQLDIRPWACVCTHACT